MGQEQPNLSTRVITRAKNIREFRPLKELTEDRHLRKLYSELKASNGSEFLSAFIDKLDLEINWEGKGKKRIPENGPFITISNHPFGILGEVVLLQSLIRKRPDFKILTTNPDFHAPVIKDEFLLKNSFGLPASHIDESDQFESIRSHLASGSPIGLFPATKIATFHRDNRRITDKVWRKPIIKLIQTANVPVIPIYFEGSNRLWFHIMGLILPEFKI